MGTDTICYQGAIIHNIIVDLGFNKISYKRFLKNLCTWSSMYDAVLCHYLVSSNYALLFGALFNLSILILSLTIKISFFIKLIIHLGSPLTLAPLQLGSPLNNNKNIFHNFVALLSIFVLDEYCNYHYFVMNLLSKNTFQSWISVILNLYLQYCVIYSHAQYCPEKMDIFVIIMLSRICTLVILIF